MNKDIAQNLKDSCRGLFFIFAFLAVFNCGLFFGENKQEGQSIMDVVTQERTYEWDVIDKPPQEFIDLASRYNNIVRFVYIALFSFAGVLTFDYFIDPEHHFATELKKRWNNLKQKIRIED